MFEFGHPSYFMKGIGLDTTRNGSKTNRSEMSYKNFLPCSDASESGFEPKLRTRFQLWCMTKLEF